MLLTKAKREDFLSDERGEERKNPLISREVDDFLQFMCGLPSLAYADLCAALAFDSLQSEDFTEKKPPRLREFPQWRYLEALEFFANRTEAAQLRRFTERAKIYAEEAADFFSPLPKAAPFHPNCDDLPILTKIHPQEKTLCAEGAEAGGFWQGGANLRIAPYELRDVKALQTELTELLQEPGANGARLREYTEIRLHRTHALFPQLQGGRGLFAVKPISAGRVIGIVSGDSGKFGERSPPVLCVWGYAIYRNGVSFRLYRNNPYGYHHRLDSYILGNRLKFVNSATPLLSNPERDPCLKTLPEPGNIGCFYAHFRNRSFPYYFSLPFYMALRDIEEGEELLTFYPLDHGVSRPEHEYC